MIVFISGSINSGKSTVSNILVKRLPNVALLEVDDLRKMIGWMPKEDAIPINLENVVSIIKNFHKNKLNVIIPYPLSRKNYDYIITELSTSDADIYFFTLSPDIEEVLKNRGTREINEEEKERIKYHYNIGIQSPNFGIVINNSKQTPEETASLILFNLTKT